MGQLAEQLERSKKEAGDSKVAGTEVKNTKSKAVSFATVTGKTQMTLSLLNYHYLTGEIKATSDKRGRCLYEHGAAPSPHTAPRRTGLAI